MQFFAVFISKGLCLECARVHRHSEKAVVEESNRRSQSYSETPMKKGDDSLKSPKVYHK